MRVRIDVVRCCLCRRVASRSLPPLVHKPAAAGVKEERQHSKRHCKIPRSCHCSVHHGRALRVHDVHLPYECTHGAPTKRTVTHKRRAPGARTRSRAESDAADVEKQTELRRSVGVPPEVTVGFLRGSCHPWQSLGGRDRRDQHNCQHEHRPSTVSINRPYR